MDLIYIVITLKEYLKYWNNIFGRVKKTHKYFRLTRLPIFAGICPWNELFPRYLQTKIINKLKTIKLWINNGIKTMKIAHIIM